MNEFIEVRTVIATILRRWWIVALLALVIGAAGYFYSINQAPVYQATTSLLVGSSIQSAEVERYDLQTSQQLATTYADLARREPILQRAIDELGLDMSWGQLRNRVRAGVPGSTQLLEVRVEADSPAKAVAIADEIARQLILLSPSGANTPVSPEDESAVRERMDGLKTKIAAGQENLAQLEEQFLVASNSEELVQLESRINTLQSMIARWEDDLSRLRNSLNRTASNNNLTVLEPAQASSIPVRPRVQLNTVVAVIMGLALALGLIILLEFLDTTLKTAHEVERTLGLSTLGAINQIKGKDRRNALVVNHDPFSPAYEDYRLLRTKIQFMSVDHPGRSVVITSPGRSEGKSLTAANLGIVMAQAGLKTVIVDANLRQPIMHELFQLASQDGLTHLLRGRDENIKHYLYPTLVPNLKVLPSGAVPSNPSELLGSRRMSEVLGELGKMVDVIICDAPEAVTVADASVLSNKVDGVLLVIDAGHTDRTVAIQAVSNLHDAKANVLGGVLNRAGSKRRSTVLAGRKASTAPHAGGDALSLAEAAGD